MNEDSEMRLSHTNNFISGSFTDSLKTIRVQPPYIFVCRGVEINEKKGVGRGGGGYVYTYIICMPTDTIPTGDKQLTHFTL